jgi:hypothetical protein
MLDEAPSVNVLKRRGIYELAGRNYGLLLAFSGPEALVNGLFARLCPEIKSTIEAHP